MDALNLGHEVPVDLLGVAFDDVVIDQALARLLARLPGQPFAYVVTPNADHLARLARSASLRQIYQAAWMRLLDSQVIAHLCRGMGLTAPPVVTGAALTARLLAALEADQHTPAPVAVIGLAAAHLPKLQSAYPHIEFLHHAPPMGLLQDLEAFVAARDFAVASRARFTLLALGSPLQEILAAAIADQAAVGVGLCIGAALEFCAGVSQRAPDWMQQAGLEWLHRLGQEPRRLLRRYLWDDPAVLWALMKTRARRHGG